MSGYSVLWPGEKRWKNVDFIFDLTPEQDLFDFIRFSRSLEELLGCKVDVVHSSALHDSIREQVLKEAIAL